MNPFARQVIVIVGAGAIGQAIARRLAPGRQLLLADRLASQAEAAAASLQQAGYQAQAAPCDVADAAAIHALAQQAQALGPVMGLVNTAGVSPSQADVRTIFQVDLAGPAWLLQAFGEVIAPGGAGLLISSQSSFRLGSLSDADNRALATLPPAELLALPLVANTGDSLRAYQIAKRGNALRVAAQAVRWGQRGARVHAISPGIIHTPLASHELNGPRQDFYRAMLAALPAGRGGTPDEVAALAEFVMGPGGAFISGSDLLMDGGATAQHFFGPQAGA